MKDNRFGNLLLMRCSTFLLLVMIFLSCTNKKAPGVQNSNNKEIDSLSLAQRQDSIERERIFKALGDTVFNSICYGMNVSQFKRAYAAFKKPRQNKEYKDYFDFADFKFYVSDSYKDITKTEIRHRIKYTDLWTEFYNNQLFSVKWSGSREIGSPHYVEKQLVTLVSLFEKKYGPANSKDFLIDYQRGIARWETKERLILILYRDLVGAERNKYMDEMYPTDKQYEIDVLFIDKTIKKEVDDFVDKELRKSYEVYKQKEKQDSINDSNAL